MAESSVVNGAVDWSGENPGMYLREGGPDGPWGTVASFFRVVISPHGPGHAAFVFMDPTGSGSDERPNACYTDNEPLARYLAEGFVSYFAAFKGNPNLGRISYRPADRFVHEGDHTSAWREIVTGPGVHLEMEWRELFDLFQLDVAPERSATGKHRMFSTFVTARSATLRLNGVEGKGQPVPRNAHGRESSTAFLAFSETWISS
jgi:hypothetical protein